MPRTTLATLVFAAAAAAAAPAHADATGEAQALFDQGITDLKAGHFDQACQELSASLAKHDDSGTKGALATCYTHLGKTASAWQLWRDLADTEPQASLRADATAKAAALEPKLPRYVVAVAAPAPAGLVVTVNGNPVDLTVHVPLPVDPGPLAVTARAPEHVDWTSTLTATEAQTTTIDVPALAAAPHTAPVGPAMQHVTLDATAQHHRRTLALEVGAAGGAALITGLVFGGVAHSKWSTAQDACGGSIDSCPGAQFAAATDAYHSADTFATVSDVLVIAGVAAIAGGAILWVTAPGPVERDAHVTLAPTASAHGGGFALSGRW